MTRLGLTSEVVDHGVVERTARRMASAGIVMPTFGELADPTQCSAVAAGTAGAGRSGCRRPANLFRVHWYNGRDRRSRADVPDHVVLPRSLTGVDAPILVAFGDRFPMIGSHKVLAAYACLAPRLATGEFDPSAHRAIWPSTGNYCRGGVAISRILGCRGVAVLPEGMSQERFDWLDRWVSDPADIVRTPGTESNVKEIYDRCAELEQEPDVVVFNQFAEFGNHLVHALVTGPALARVVDRYRDDHPHARAAAFVSATGSAGTIAAGDHLKEREGTRIVAVEALECPTLTENGFGEHNIQGIGDKHVPFIHNVMNTDAVVAISDVATDQLNVLFGTAVGRRYLADRHGVGDEVLAALDSFGLSSICNILAAIEIARHDHLGPDDLVVTVATDGASMYASERDKALRRDFPGGFDEVAAAQVYGTHVAGAGLTRVLPLGEPERRRIFNLGYFTWVEQQGVSLEAFVMRRHQSFWTDIRSVVPAWDELIADLNARAAAVPA